jgi:hypothetical protein
MIFQLAGTQKYFDSLGTQLPIKVIGVDEARTRGFLPPIPKTKTEESYENLVGQTIAQLRDIIFLWGPANELSQMAKQIITEKEAQADKLDRELEREAAEARSMGVNSSSIPLPASQGSNQ